MPVNFVCFRILIFQLHYEGNQYLDWLFGLVFFYFRRVFEDGSVMPRHVGVLTLYGPCIVIYLCNKNQPDALSVLIYSNKYILYMF